MPYENDRCRMTAASEFRAAAAGTLAPLMDAPPAPTVFGLRDLHRRVSIAISRELRGPVWVRAEIGEMNERNGYCFLTLAEPARDRSEGDASLDVVIWRNAWDRIRRQLDERGLALRKGLTVTFRGELRLRDGSGQLQLRCASLDTDALLGELAARRLALRRALAVEGLLDANRRLQLQPVPLRLGVVASTHSQGYHDFCAVLVASRYRFDLVVEPVLVQGTSAPATIAGALALLGDRSVDLIVVVRGGGARADLDAFDHELVARAIAAAPVPVWTGLGHTGDQCLADEMAHASHATPTACAHALVATVAAFVRDLDARARRVAELAEQCTAAADERLRANRRALASCGRAQLDRHADRGAARSTGLRRAASAVLSRASTTLDRSVERLPRGTGMIIAREQERLRSATGRVQLAAPRALAARESDVVSHQRVLSALDPSRLLERGWTLTLDEAGHLVRSAGQLRAGQRIVSRFADGDRFSVVQS